MSAGQHGESSLNGMVVPQINFATLERGGELTFTTDPERQARLSTFEDGRLPGVLYVGSIAVPENPKSYHALTDPNTYTAHGVCLSIVEGAAGRLAVLTASAADLYVPSQSKLLVPDVQDPGREGSPLAV